MSGKPQSHRPAPKRGSVKIKLDAREFDSHLCGRTKNGFTVHIFRRDEMVECEPDEKPARWVPAERRA